MAGKFLYVSNDLGNSINAFTINATTGALSSAGSGIGNGLNLPGGLAVDPTSKFLYTANSGNNTISEFSINQSTGALTGITATPGGFGGLLRPQALTFDPSGSYLYAGNGDSKAGVPAFKYNTVTGALMVIAGSPFLLWGGMSFPWIYEFAFDPTGQRIYASDYASGQLSWATIGAGGALTAQAPLGGCVTSFGIAIDSRNGLYLACDGGPVTLLAFTLNSAGGASPAVPPNYNEALNPFSVTVDPTGQFLFSLDGSLYTYRIGNNGQLTLLGSAALALDPSSPLQFVTTTFATP
jgi:6-phosphogluconolactonase